MIWVHIIIPESGTNQIVCGLKQKRVIGREAKGGAGSFCQIPLCVIVPNMLLWWISFTQSEGLIALARRKHSSAPCCFGSFFGYSREIRPVCLKEP